MLGSLLETVGAAVAEVALILLMCVEPLLMLEDWLSAGTTDGAGDR